MWILTLFILNIFLTYNSRYSFPSLHFLLQHLSTEYNYLLPHLRYSSTHYQGYIEMIFLALKQPFPVPSDDEILSHPLHLLCWVFPEGLHPQSDVTVYSSDSDF